MTMKIKVLYFGQARDASGKGEESLTLPDRSSVDLLLQRSSATHPGIAKMKKILQVAVNEDISDSGRVLRDGDVVALLPPIAGG